MGWNEIEKDKLKREYREELERKGKLRKENEITVSSSGNRGTIDKEKLKEEYRRQLERKQKEKGLSNTIDFENKELLKLQYKKELEEKEKKKRKEKDLTLDI